MWEGCALLVVWLARGVAAQQANFLPRTCGSSPHVAAFEATIQTSVASPGYPALASMNDGHTVFGYCDGSYRPGTPSNCPAGTRAFTLVEFDLSELDENVEICMASISMQQTDNGVNVQNIVAYNVEAPFTDQTEWQSIQAAVRVDEEMIHASTCEDAEVFRGQGRHEFAAGRDFEELVQNVLKAPGASSLRIAIGATEGNEMDSLCKPRSTYDEANHHHEVNGFQCTQGVTLHLTYHSGGLRGCNAAGWNAVYQGCDAVQSSCGGSVGDPCECDEVCADQLDAFNKQCIGSIDGVSVGPVQRVEYHRKHAQMCEAISGGLLEKNTLVAIQFAGTTQRGVDPNGFLDGVSETLCLAASGLTDQLPVPGIGVELRPCDTNADGAVDVRDTPDMAKWILRPDGRIQNAATMLCLRRADCTHGQAPNMGPPGVWDLHDCSTGSVFMTWSDPGGTDLDTCPSGWHTPGSDTPCVTRGNCHDCPAPHHTVEGYPKPGGPFHMEEVVGASLVDMIRGTKRCGDHTTECFSPQPITADLIGREGGLCGTHLKQTNTGQGNQEDAWWIFEQISGPGMSEAQAILSMTLNAHHRNLIAAASAGQQSCEANDPDDPTKDCPTLRNALAVALTIPPRDITLVYIDTALGRVDFQVIGGRAARHLVEEAMDTRHTGSENYGLLAEMGTIISYEFADNPVMKENEILAQCNGGPPPGDGPILGPTVVDRSGCPTDEACNKLWTSGWKPASLHCLQETAHNHYQNGGLQTYIIPANMQAVTIWISGGGGGLGSQAHPRSTGGAAGFTWATFRVQKEWNNELKVLVGCAGESAGVGVQGVGGGGGGGTAVLDPQGNVLAVAGGAGGQAGAWDASRQVLGEMSSTHGGHGGGLQGADGGTTPCNGGAAGGGGGGQTQPGTAGGASRGYDPGQPGNGHNGGDGGGFTLSCTITDETEGTPEYEDACDDRLGCIFTPPSKIATSFCRAGEACCGVQTIGGMAGSGNITTYGGSGWGTGGMGHTVPCDGGGGGGGGGWRGGGGGGGSCHGTGGGGGSSYINTAYKGYVGGGTLPGRGSMETVDGWAWLVPVVCDPDDHDHHGWHWWQWVLLVLILALVGYLVSLHTDRIGDLCGDSLAKLQGGSSRRSSHALGIVSLALCRWHDRGADIRLAPFWETFL